MLFSLFLDKANYLFYNQNGYAPSVTQFRKGVVFMPPKAKFSKEEIVDAALNIVVERGEAALSTREIAAVLGVSTRPIFTYFSTMNELKAEVEKAAAEVYREYTESGLKEKDPLLGFGMKYIDFAKNEPNLYKMLFLPHKPKGEKAAFNLFESIHPHVIESTMKTYTMERPTAEDYMKKMLVICQGFAAMIISGNCPFEESEIAELGSYFSLALCTAYKDIPGFAEGTADLEKEFGKIVFPKE